MRVGLRILLNLSLLVGFFIGPKVQATDIQIGESYRVTSTLQNTNGGSISVGTYIKVIGTHQGWAYGVQRLGDNFVPLTGTEYISQDWTGRSVTPLTINEVVQMVQSAPAEVDRVTEAPCDCNREIENAIALALEETPPTPVQRPAPVRPVARPVNLGAHTFSTFIFKDEDEADQYFACYQKDTDLQMDYAGTYKNSIRRMSRVYGQQTGGTVNQDDMDTLMSCLIFRESAHWRGTTSSKGAKGLGQFTPDGRAEVREILNYNPNNVRDHDDRIRERTGERDAGRISDAQLRIDIRNIEVQRKRHDRMVALKRMWEAMPMQNRPSADDITPEYTANNNNHESIMAMSALLIRNCQIRLENNNFDMDPRTSLLACAGAYNMGVGGFRDNALVRNGPQSLQGWLQNLRNSSDDQADETYNHLVSVHRCISDGENFPPCGTGQDYCTALPMADACQNNADPRCLGECR